MAVLPTPGSPIRTGIVLGPAGQYLDGAADFLVAPDHRIQLAFAGDGGEVAGVLLQGVVAVLGIGALGLAALAEFVDGLVQGLAVHTGAA